MMPNIKSAQKRVKVNAVKAMQNKALKSNLKTVIKKAELATADGAADMQDSVKLAVKKIDQACAKGLMHKNCASRKKSHLVSKMNAAAAK